MTGTSLISAVTVGLVLGGVARLLVPTCRDTPFWLPMAVGVCAAVLASIVARLAGLHPSQVSPFEVLLQVVLAGLSVGGVALTADHRPSDTRYRQSGELR